MGLNHKARLYLSVAIGNLLMIASASCELITFPVSFVNEDKSSVPSETPKPNKPLSNDAPVVYAKPVEKNRFSKEKLSAAPAPAPAPAATKSIISSKDKYNLHSAMLMAVSWHPEIKRAISESERLKSMIDEVKSAYYPNVQMGLNSGIAKDDYSDDNNKTNQLNLSVEQMIYDFGSTSDRVELSQLNVANAGYEIEKEINDILYQTISAYLQIVRYHQLSAGAKERIDGFTKIKDLTKKRVALGASAESDYSQANLRVAEALSNYNDYISQYKKWLATLDHLLNKKISASIIMEFPTEIEELYNNILRDNPVNTDSPAIRIARAKIDIAKKQIDVQKNEYYPTITLAPYYEHDLTEQSASNGSTKNRDRYGAFINVKVPLYQGGSVSSKVQQAQDALNTAQFNLDAEKNNAEQRIMEYSSQMRNTKISLENKREREQSAIRTRNLYMSQYLELGARSVSDLTSAEADIHQTKADIINSNYTVSNLAMESLYYAGKLINLMKNKG
ncbi:TPA: TolC family protein [Klebsiella aerogenes]|nr:TolC family protein [Klebsiella aerogenes]